MDAKLETLSQDIKRAFAARAQVGVLAATDRYEKCADFTSYNLRGEREPVLATIRDLRRRSVSAVKPLYAMRDLKSALRVELLAIQ